MTSSPAGPSSASAPEWAAAQETVLNSALTEPERWAAMARCPSIEAYTDGSAPVLNPGGPAGMGAVLVCPPDGARLEIGAYVPARKSEPRTSNNRAEIGGLLLVLEAVRRLAGLGWRGRALTIWSDSRYAVYCATGLWKRNKNTDLWVAYDRLAAEVRRALPQDGLALEWVKGHAGHEQNESADRLATLAAFNFDEGAYRRFRAAQAATGLEMPPPGAEPPPPPEPPGPRKVPGATTWLGADYAVEVQTRFTVQDQKSATGKAVGTYRLLGTDGWVREREVEHEGPRLHDEGEYLTLAAALEDLTGRTGKLPCDLTLRVEASRELVARQLRGEYRVKAAVLQEPYARVAALLARFKHVEVEWKRTR